jgi:hypothetical protein
MSANNRETREDKALAIVRQIHLDRYGMADIDEDYIRDLSDSELGSIIETDRLVSESRY